MAQAATSEYQTGWLKQQKLIPHSSRGWKVSSQGLGKVGFILRPLFLAYRWLPCHRVLTWLLHVAQREEEEEGGSGESVVTQG